MRSVGLKTLVPATKGLAELDHHDRDELKGARNGSPFDGQGLSEEDESRINEDVNSGRRIELVQQPHNDLHRPHQQPQGPLVQWERFLPLRSLKVLLVENDDSTRHVVSALLRNCSYEVTAVANGLEAWKVLIDPDKQIDLVLTEVMMPYLSGIGLLSKITNHMTRKNLPVIMMSSDDSMGIVFNCLSKGAVDFLVKPIRKNELKNLWQHVWRKCHSSSGSGSESGIQTRKSTKSRSNQESDENSDNSDDDISIDLTAKDGSDNGSGTQSSWSKRVVEVDSSQAKSSWDKLPNPRDSICIPAARPETSKNHWQGTAARKEHATEDEKLEIVEMGKDLEIGVPIEDADKKGKEKFCEFNPKKADDELDTSMQLGCTNSAPRTEALGATKISNAHMEAVAKANQLLKNINIEDKSNYYSKESPALELSLKRPRDMEDAADASAQERNVLRHSGLSAFSRYNTVSNVNQAPTGIVGSCSPLDISSEAAKPDKKQSNSNGTPNQRSNGSDDMGSTTNNAFTKPDALADDKAAPNGSTIAVHHNHASTLQPLIPGAAEGETAKNATGQPKGVQQQVHVRHHHHHYHHHHHHVHKMQQQKLMNPDDGSLKNMVSNILTASDEGNAANYGSASGSNNKSNGENGSSGQKGTSSAPVVEGGAIASDNGDARKGNAEDGSGSGSGRGSGVDQDRVTHREAVLNKFRQKRKERCFEKKVRYQSRKKLAEQRPRVRGQFVRHGANGMNNEDADS
ncbi:two-component response regulator-like PRR73 isoform X2 [Cynara cardunculus var. scolymus]|uniref:two-component response regulator-like PRR73 isoform X2 n=1 Tax=Cynara cardunculus var. scolymus TaxID=59895 RepID=UPI000D62CA4C|nr:two-component response regulator-like PRR73 isoform X2 [Cynara cardunculus var. scolymus]